MPLGWVAAGVAVVDAYGNIKQGNKAGKQGDRQLALEERSMAMDESKFAEQQVYAGSLNSLINNPSQLKDLPGYQFQLDQGSEAVRRKMAASGFAGSGNMATALTEFGQGLASNFYSQQANLLASLSGLQTAQTPNAGQFGQVASSYNAQSNDAYARAMSSLGYLAGSYSNAGFNQSPIMSGSPYFDGSGYGYNMPGG